MSGYDYEPPRRERSAPRQQYYREEYADPHDPYLRVTNTRDLIPRGPEESVEEIQRDFPPPGYRRGAGDVQRARSAEPYDYYDDDDRSVYTRRSRDDYYDDYPPRRSRAKKTESVYIEEEEHKRKRMLGKQEKIIAAVAGAAVALGGKELFDRKQEQDDGEAHRNVLSSAALGAAGAFAAYQGAEFYNKRSSKQEKKSTHIVHKGRDGRVTEYYSDDDDDEKEKKGNKNFLESALAAAGLGGALKALTGGGGGGDKEKEKHRDRDHDRDRGARGDNRSRAGSRSRSRSRSRSPDKGGGNKIQKAAMASLIAGATEAFRVSKEPGDWKGEKAKRILTAAAGAATIDAAQKPGKDGSKLGLAESVIGGLIGNRMINGSKRDIIEDRDTGRSRSRSRAPSENGSKKGGGGMGLAALATAGLGAIGAKKAVDNIREDRSRSRRRSPSRDSYDSRDQSPPKRQRSRSRSVVDTARRGLAKIGFGKGDGASDAGSRRGGRYSDDDDDSYYSRDARDTRYRDGHDDDRVRARSRSAGPRSRGAPSRSRASSRGSASSSSDLGDSEEDEKAIKKMRGKQIITSGLAAVATIHAAHNVYQSMEKRNARHKAVKAGKLSSEEAKKLKSKAMLQDAASVGIAALGIKGAISEMKEAREMSHEVAEWKEKKEERHNKRLARLERQRKKLEYPSDDDYFSDVEDDRGTMYDDRRSSGPNSRAPSRVPSRAPTGPLRDSRYDEGPRYNDGNPYAALPAPPVGYRDQSRARSAR